MREFASLYKKSSYVESNLAIAYQLLALMKNDESKGAATDIAFQMCHIQDIEPRYEVPFYDIALGSAPDLYPSYLDDVVLWLKKLKDEFNPHVTKREKEKLDKYTLPLLAKIRDAKSKDRPGVFIEICNELVRLVRSGQISIFAAAEEISHTLDRPEIIKSKKLRAIIKAAFKLEQPGLLVQSDPEIAWDEFVQTVVAYNNK